MTLDDIKAAASKGTITIRGGGILYGGNIGKQTRGTEVHLPYANATVMCLYTPSASGKPEHATYDWYVNNAPRDEAFVKHLLDSPQCLNANATWGRAGGDAHVYKDDEGKIQSQVDRLK
ncbi:hypothetical protein ACFQ3P_13725 [Paraburkholderia sabiae]|uniref:Uncharacterized protein n=1 Tax=Paraburkholderia sabiae TaxID=273251 RepID=A0ABU9QD61_9BURK|nr:hypothetical protein [Paraburkholderia sabiae]WJZ76158.1 hypothetical protein QEN71_10265 [Paraburkholderia sabiae]CAD6526085.1 hypothetical protein LMG24235_01917 [Paraburkholderia sabiae]